MDHIIPYLQNIISFVLIISVIVFIHEFGHYLVAKLNAVRIEVFSIGFGPEIFGWNDKSGTRWKVSALPLGGYVKMFGDVGPASTPDQEKISHMTEEEKAHAFHAKRLSQKAAIVVAGPTFNFLLAIVILTGFFVYYGKPHTIPEVAAVMKDSAAAKIGLAPGDLILELDGNKIERFEELRGIASMNPGTAMPIKYLHGKKEITATITPELSESTDIFGNKVKIGLLGISSNRVGYDKVPLHSAFGEAVKETYILSANTLKALGQIIVGKRDSSELSGILRIGKYSGQAAAQGLSSVLWFMAILSVNLGLVNLFPIPLLDGGHLLYYAIEAIKGKPMADRMQQIGFRFGLAVLVTLMVFATFNDLKYFNLF